VDGEIARAKIRAIGTRHRGIRLFFVTHLVDPLEMGEDCATLSGFGVLGGLTQGSAALHPGLNYFAALRLAWVRCSGSGAGILFFLS
jgi:hypothetical protein